MIPKRVMVFEDDKTRYDGLSVRLRPGLLKLGCQLERYDSSDISDSCTMDIYRNSLRQALLKPQPCLLVIVDWDLSKYRVPVARELIKGICNEMSIPICVYHYRMGTMDRIKGMKKWQANELTIDNAQTMSSIAGECLAYSHGFFDIWKAFSGRRKRNLGDTFRQLLKCPDATSGLLEQYFWGAVGAFEVARQKGDERLRFITTHIGYWIRNQLLQFPGVLLNEVAAASYLNVDPEEFKTQSKLQKPFDPALYRGPFGDVNRYWWTIGLEDIISKSMGREDSMMITGREFLRRKGLVAKPCKCVRGHVGAGYFCIITQAPVCEKHSVKPRGWLPMGAVRSRIEKKKYYQLSPWINV